MQYRNYTSYFVVVKITGVLKRPGCTNDWGGPHARMAHLPADYVKYNLLGKLIFAWRYNLGYQGMDMNGYVME